MKHKITVACGVFYKGQILMIEEIQDGKKVIDIPAGGLDLHESLEDGVHREVKEETGIEIESTSLVGVFQFLEKRRTTISFLYRSDLNAAQKPDKTEQENDEEILTTEFYPVTEINSLLKKNPDKFEHPLAIARLNLLLENNREKETTQISNLNPIVVNS